MAAGVYITAVSDIGHEKVLVSLTTIHLPVFFLSHFLFLLCHCLSLTLLPSYHCCKVKLPGAPLTTPSP